MSKEQVISGLEDIAQTASQLKSLVDELQNPDPVPPPVVPPPVPPPVPLEGPKLSVLPDVELAYRGTARVGFSVSDPEYFPSQLSVQFLLQDGIALLPEGDGIDRILNVTHTADEGGTWEVFVTVTNPDSMSISDSFLVSAADPVVPEPEPEPPVVPPPPPVDPDPIPPPVVPPPVPAEVMATSDADYIRTPELVVPNFGGRPTIVAVQDGMFSQKRTFRPAHSSGEPTPKSSRSLQRSWNDKLSEEIEATTKPVDGKGGIHVG